MDFAQIARYFNSVTLDGWDEGTQSWVPAVAVGTYEVYDRFISGREFGYSLRKLLVPEPLPAQYKVVRLPSLEIWLVGAVNTDINHDIVYNYVYLLRRAAKVATLRRLTTQAMASGARGAPVKQVVGSYYIDLERITSGDADQFPAYRFMQSAVYFPAGTVLTTDDEVIFDNRVHDVEEVFDSMGFSACRVSNVRRANP